MSENKPESSEKAEKSADPELDELLDSALQDLKIDKPEAKAEKSEASGESTEGFDNPEWTEEFIKQAAQQFESNMANLFNNMGGEMPSGSLQENFQKMAEAAQQVITNPTLDPTPESANFASTISQTLHNLSLGTDNLQNPFSEADLAGLFSASGAGAGGNQFLPFMQGMMQSLLSKEVLLPSLQELLDRYPSWLDQEREGLAEGEARRYEQQMHLMQRVCTELKAETPDDAEDARRERFERVLALMQEMQALGQPPAALVGEPGPPLGFDAQGNPVLPDNLDPNNCQLM